MADGLAEYPTELLRFIARFERGEYWLAHEELEPLWLADRRDFYKGLIQVAAAFVHIERHNWHGAERLLRTALAYLRRDPDHTSGFDAITLCARVGAVQREVAERVSVDPDSRQPVSSFSMVALIAAEVPPHTVDDVELPYRARRHE